MAPDRVIDSEALAAWMSGVGLDVTGRLAVGRIGAGHSNLTYKAVDERGRAWVLRRPPVGPVLQSAHDVAREYRILSALTGTDVPIPEIHGLCEDPEVSDAPVMVVGYVDGRVISSTEQAEATPVSVRGRIGASMARTMAKIHAVDLESTGLATLASHEPYASRQLRRWVRQWELSATRDLPLVQELADRLAAGTPDQAEVTLVHGDFHLLNVLTDHASGNVVAVLDWELCTLGDPLADIGSTMAYWTQLDDEPIVGFRGPRLEGFPDREEMLRMYAEASGRDVRQVWFWYVLGLWKIAIITEGVYRRAIDNPLNASADGHVDPEVVPLLLLRADKAAERSGL